ncbi:hypothetical protein Y032_0552g3337 [Ancylostoma ceylanicum]|uniref:DUF4440 domain-containing protein n=2 Tax=Ancylostoma ceylanicum TaxID=53326 RepID=A0A016WPX7_9BILA|nr:hypothetical protein Y032_0552g3337 [Ancylostoma ceylanicum]
MGVVTYIVEPTMLFWRKLRWIVVEPHFVWVLNPSVAGHEELSNFPWILCCVASASIHLEVLSFAAVVGLTDSCSLAPISCGALPGVISSLLAKTDKMAIDKPLLLDYVHTFNAGNFDRMAAFYHKNAVMVEKDKSVLWGQKDIVASLLDMATVCGKTRMEISNTKYEGAGDFLHVTTDFAFHTEKSGILRGSFLQIWRRDNHGYAIYHDEYEMH